MGSLKDRFYSIFKRAVPFEPIHDIEEFIGSFVCDSDTRIDTRDMQDNIRYYKHMEIEEAKIGERISFLGDIEDKYESYLEEKNRLLIQQYLLDRAEVHHSEIEIDEMKLKITLKIKDRNELLELIETQKLKLDELDKRIEILNEEFYGSDLKREYDNLQSQLEVAKNRIGGIKNSIHKLYSMLHNTATAWKYSCESHIEKQIRFNDDLLALEDGLYTGIDYILSHNKDNVVEISTDELNCIKEQMTEYLSGISDYKAEINNSLKTLISETNKLENEIADLKKGIKPYPDKVTLLKTALKDELSKKFGNDISVELVCDLIEIEDTKWRNAIEGYLHTQKLYLVVDPEHFIDALRIYDRYKNQHNIYDVGLLILKR